MVSRYGLSLVVGAGFAFSLGGGIARFINLAEPWVVMFWRALFFTLFMVVFSLWRYGTASFWADLRGLGRSGVLVALCTACAMMCFVGALFYTSVAQVVLIQSCSPLMASLTAWALFGEKTQPATWWAMLGVGLGLLIMIGSPQATVNLGTWLAFGAGLSFAFVPVLARKNPHLRLVPALTLAGLISMALAAIVITHKGAWILPVGSNLGWLVAFGMVNLGFGNALYVSGARYLPASLSALIILIEPAFSPLWTWLIHGEIAPPSTLVGGAIILLALTMGVVFSARHEDNAVVAPHRNH